MNKRVERSGNKSEDEWLEENKSLTGRRKDRNGNNVRKLNRKGLTVCCSPQNSDITAMEA